MLAQTHTHTLLGPNVSLDMFATWSMENEYDFLCVSADLSSSASLATIGTHLLRR